MEEKQRNIVYQIVPPAVLAAGIAIIFYAWLYRGTWTENKAEMFAQLHLPLGRVGYNFITWVEFENFFTQSPNGDMSKLFLAYTLEESDRQLMKRLNVQPTADVDTRTALIIAWTSDQKLNADGFARLSQIQRRLQTGESFAELARSESDDPATKQFDGDAGFINLEDTLPEFRHALVDVTSGDQKVIPTRNGLYLVQVEEISQYNVSAEMRLHLLTILIANTDFDEWYSQARGNISSSFYRH